MPKCQIYILTYIYKITIIQCFTVIMIILSFTFVLIVKVFISKSFISLQIFAEKLV